MTNNGINIDQIIGHKQVHTHHQQQTTVQKILMGTQGDGRAPIQQTSVFIYYEKKSIVVANNTAMDSEG